LVFGTAIGAGKLSWLWVRDSGTRPSAVDFRHPAPLARHSAAGLWTLSFPNLRGRDLKKHH